MDFQQLTTSFSLQLSQLVNTSTNGVSKPIRQKDGQHFSQALELLSIEQVEALKSEKNNRLSLDSLTIISNILPSQMLNNEVIAKLTQGQIAEWITDSPQATSETPLADNKNTELLSGLWEKQLDKVGEVTTTKLGDSQVQELKVDNVHTVRINGNPSNKSLDSKLLQLTNNGLNEKVTQTETTGDNLLIQDNSRSLQNKPTLFSNNVSLPTVDNKAQNNGGQLILNDGQVRFSNTLAKKESETTPVATSNLKVTTASELVSKSNSKSNYNANSNLEKNGNFSNDLGDKTPNQANSSQLTGTNNFQGLLEQVHNDKGSNIETSVTVEEIPDYLTKQIKSKAHVIKPDGSSELSIKLKPEELGKLTLKISSQDGQVTVKILTENNHTRGLVEQNLTQLKQNLNNQGIKYNSIDVQVGSDSNLQQFFGQQSNPFNNSRYTTKFKFSNKSKGDNQLFIDSLDAESENKNNRNMGLGKVEFFA